MANPYKEYGTDKNLEKNGVLYVHEPKTEEYPAQCFVLARAGGSNTKFLKAADKAFRPHRKKGIENIDPFLMRSLMVQVFAETIVLDWEGVFDREDNEMPYSQDNVVKLFTDLPDLFDVIQEQASSLNNYLLDEVESDVKN